MAKAFSIDLNRCIGCHACSVSCKTEHDVPLGSFRTRVRYLSRPDDHRLKFVPTMCMHCEDAPCLKVCPTQAIFKRGDGTVDIDGDKCCGNKACVTACPYDAIFIDQTTGKADKCDSCADRRQHNLQPACVESCPTEAIKFTTPDPSDSALLAWAKTRPNVKYKGLEDWMHKTKHVNVQIRKDDEDIIYERQ